MRIACWNVNSIRSRLPRLLPWLEATRPDVVCLQELKCVEEKFPSTELAGAGYLAAVHGQKTYNGVAILARAEPADVTRGMRDGVEDPQSRVIAATVGAIRVVCVYAPNGQSVGSPAYGYKLEWFGRLRRFLEAQRALTDRLLVCGDFNVAPEDRDVCDPVAWEGQTMASEPEREAFRSLLALGLVDAFRLHHAEAGRYSWWDYRMLSFPKNLGLRIDHLLVTPELAARCRASGIDREMRKGKQPSDHAPVWVEIDT